MFQSSETKKHQDFCREPMGEKLVEEIPGIGYGYGGRLKAKGFGKAANVLGQYLLYDGNDVSIRFKLWLFWACDGHLSEFCADRCILGLQEWCDNNMNKSPVSSISCLHVLASTLNAKGYGMVHHVVGQFLVYDGDKDLFKAWFKWICGADPWQADECYLWVQEWCSDQI